MKIRLILFIGGLILLFTMTSTIYYLYRKVQELETQVPELIAIANDSARVAKTYRDENNILHSHNRVLMIERDNARKLEEFAWIKVEGVNKKLKNLVQTTKIDAGIDTTVTVRPIPYHPENLVKAPIGDLGGQTIVAVWPGVDQILYEDEYNSVAIDSAGVNLTLKIDVPIRGVVYWERPHKFLFFKWGKKQYVSDFSSPNTLVKISNHEVIQVRKK